jgi:type 1 glutamine amidotransferase
LAALFSTGEPRLDRIQVLVVSGRNNHDWSWTSASLQRMLERSGRFLVDVTDRPSETLADRARLAKYRALVLDYNGERWGEAAESAFLDAVRSGTGVAVIHAANNAFADWPEYRELVGDCWVQGRTGHGAFHAFDLEVVDRAHPITAGLGEITAHPDELYHDLVRTSGTNHRVLATAFSSKESGGTGEDEPMILVGSYGAGRVFHTPLGHVWPGNPAQRASHDDPQFQRLVARGVEWAATGEVAPETGWNDLDASLASDAERLAGQARAASSDERPWTVLFDGKDTAAWRGYGQESMPAKGWSVRDGALVCEKGGGGGDLVTAESFGDFELEFEWRVAPGANSGVMVRVADLDAPTWNSGPEYQVLDDAALGAEPDALHAAGAIYDVTPAADLSAALPPGGWNRGRIVCQGFKLAHYLNGVLTAACDFSSADGRARVARSKFAAMPHFMKHERGRIALQDHGDEVAYRNLRIRPLAATAIALFDGRSLDGWTWIGSADAGAGEVWQAREGVLVCRGTPAGYLRTDADYTNYVLELDWRWNPAAEGNRNSGVLLRVIEEDKIWPKSLEAQLQDGNAGDFWKIGDFPAATDPARTNGRNAKKLKAAEKPLGEWNHYAIRVDHGTVTLEVNGELVNRATGVLETPGKIALQSEGAEIQFKNVRLTPLP